MIVPPWNWRESPLTLLRIFLLLLIFRFHFVWGGSGLDRYWWWKKISGDHQLRLVVCLSHYLHGFMHPTTEFPIKIGSPLPRIFFLIFRFHFFWGVWIITSSVDRRVVSDLSLFSPRSLLKWSKFEGHVWSNGLKPPPRIYLGFEKYCRWQCL